MSAMNPLPVPNVECVETSNVYGRFTVEPLEKGYGTTLGNSLRRVLLSSLYGAAITWLKIEGTQHEFSTLPHVKEDTIDFLLNVKAIRLRSLTKRPGKLVLDVEGEGEVCAADISPSADFEIANPELHLATLDSAEAKLSVEFNVEIGKGYAFAGSSDGLPIGAIPLDAVFSPVQRVNYTVEPVRLGQETGRERLILEVWTDGTLSPTEAVSESANILIEQSSPFRGLVETRAEEEVEFRAPKLPADQYNTPIEQLNLSTRTYNSLRRGSITTLGQLLEKSGEELLSLPGFGAKSREEVEKVLKELGVYLLQEVKEKKKKAKVAQSQALSEDRADEA